MLRRCLLGLTTTLIVARPLIPGEDPGRLSPLAGVAGLFITSFWLLAAFGWTVWRLWARVHSWRGSLLEVGLLLAVVALGFSAGFAAVYQRPAWLIAWDWAGLLAAFCLVRQLPRSEEEQRGLLAVLLATGVSLAAQGCYQFVHPPAPPTPLDATLAAIYGPELNLAGDIPSSWPPNPVVGLFAESSTLAALLVLLLPPLAIGTSLVARDEHCSRLRIYLTGSCFAVACLALGLTRWWPAILSLSLAAIGLLLLVRQQLATRTLVFGIAAAVMASLPVLSAPQQVSDILAARSEATATTVAMIFDGNFGLGVGPGLFGRYYPSYQASPEGDALTNPGNFLLELQATGGLFALAGVLLALFGFYRCLRPQIEQPWFDEHANDVETLPASSSRRGGDPEASEEPLPPPLRWEFYLGGVGGLTAAFLPQLGRVVSHSELGNLGLLAFGRFLVWFVAFVLLERIPWTLRGRAASIAAGVLALLLCLLLTGGFFYSSLNQPLWIMMALAVNAVPAGEQDWSRLSRATALLPVPLVAAVWWIYLLVFLVPVNGSAMALARARSAYPVWREQIEPKLDSKMEEALALQTGEPRSREKAALEASKLVSDSEQYLEKAIFQPLTEAAKHDPGNVQPWVELAWWSGESWELFVRLRHVPRLLDSPQVRKKVEGYMVQSMSYLKEAEPTDSTGKAPFWTAYHLRLRYASQPGVNPVNAAQQYTMAANNLEFMLSWDPNNPRLHYLLADTLRRVPEQKQQKWRDAADRAKLLDEQAGPTRKLTDPERDVLWGWLKTAEKN